MKLCKRFLGIQYIRKYYEIQEKCRVTNVSHVIEFASIKTYKIGGIPKT